MTIVNEKFAKCQQLREEGKLDEAIEQYKEVLKIAPRNIAALKQLARVYEQQEKWSDAANCYQKIIAFKPNLAEAYLKMGKVLKRQNKLDEAVAACQQAVELQPDLLKALDYKQLGDLILQLRIPDNQKLNQAQKLYEKAIKLDPASPTFYYCLAQVLMRSHKFDAAKGLLQQNYNILSENTIRFNRLFKIIENIERDSLKEKQKCNNYSQFESVIIKGLIDQDALPVGSVSKEQIALQENIKKISDSCKVLICEAQEPITVSSQAKCFDDFCPTESSYIKKKLNLPIRQREKQSLNILVNCLFDGTIYIDGNSYILKETVVNSYSKLYFESIAFPKDKREYNETVFILPCRGGQKNYYHILIDQLSCLIFYEKLNLSYKILISKRTKLHNNILNYLNLPSDRILQAENNYFKFSHLITSKYKFDVETVLFYRETIRNSITKLYNFDSKSRGRIYISRKQSSRRKLLNEDQVEKLMEKLGFSVVYCEQLSFEEQVCLMSKASIVVSPHGAGLTNIIFCNPGTAIVELLPDSYLKETYYKMSVMCNHNYYPVLGYTTESSNCQWRVDLDKLERIIFGILLP